MNIVCMCMSLIGFLIFLEPIVAMVKAGCKTEEDALQWLMNMPLEYIQSFEYKIVGGISLVLLGFSLLVVLPK